jgi:hypothetical protein
MKLLSTLLLLAAPALAAAQIVVQPLQRFGTPGTLRNPYVVSEYGEPRFRFNTPQMGAVPPSQPFLVTPGIRPLGSDWGDPFGGRGVLGRD